MKNKLNFLLLTGIITMMLAVSVSCIDNGQTEDSLPVKDYYTITFNSEVDNIKISPYAVAAGSHIYAPFVDYRDGYRLLGWKPSGESELFSFDSPVNRDLTLNAVWEKEEEGLIYDNMTRVFIIHDGSRESASFANTVYTRISVSNHMGVGLYSYIESAERYHEIVIGKTDREISKTAYSELEKLTAQGDELAYLIYSDGKSIALAYTDEYAEETLSLFKTLVMDKYISSNLALAPGIYDDHSLTIENYYTEYDDKKSAKEWELLENYLTIKIGKEASDKFVAALRDLYSMYKPEMIEWYANLYDPEIGGYYYSNSARDNDSVEYNGSYYALLPDIESTNQALNFINLSGMSDNYVYDLPEFMKDRIVNFVKSCQDPNGYFYHPQWTKAMTDSHTTRRSRDLSWAENILQKFGARPYYTTPGGMQGTGGKITSSLTLPLSRTDISLVSYVVPTAVANANLKDKDSFLGYLERLDINRYSYDCGSELSSQCYEIKERDRQLEAEGADYRFMDILINWLNEHQIPETGHWSTKSNYYGVNGLLKISGIYNSAGVPFPNAKAATQSAIDAITSDEAMGAVVDLYNTWYSIDNIVKNIRKYGSKADNEYADEMIIDLMLEAPYAIKRSKEKVAIFQKTDGSFSYRPTHASVYSQGMPVTIPYINEGDVNATGICYSWVSYMMQSMELGSYRPSLFGKTEMKKYIEIIEENNSKVN